jgi:Cu-Zn family superoxide dismutase
VRGLLAIVWAAVAFSGCAAPKELPTLTAAATLKDKDGKEVGRATLVETLNGVRVAVSGYRLPPGVKALVLSDVGVCQPPQFASAGPRRSRGGNLPSMSINAAGEGGIDEVNRDITLSPGSASLFGDNGTALLVIASPDALRTDPTGTGGSRIACGVIVRE